MFTAACILALAWIGAAVVIARRQHAPVLWGRAALILAGAYAAGAWAGWWPWTQAAPLIGWTTTWLGG